ncbi:hypothetical protein AVEN_1942-1 [Araneus ventricosus]|uniref:Uncharacterized protein n=1 Tax=Araneus ventricosus TaxID=182803 RepID=A0A4Y2GBI9_ARAVE|nr:hypothetical protein AVEN_1942-1 [Araneus ventricosus]
MCKAGQSRPCELDSSGRQCEKPMRIGKSGVGRLKNVLQRFPARGPWMAGRRSHEPKSGVKKVKVPSNEGYFLIGLSCDDYKIVF